jgi:hypothetical protein
MKYAKKTRCGRIQLNRRSASTFRKRHLSTSGDACRRHGGPDRATVTGRSQAAQPTTRWDGAAQCATDCADHPALSLRNSPATCIPEPALLRNDGINSAIDRSSLRHSSIERNRSSITPRSFRCPDIVRPKCSRCAQYPVYRMSPVHTPGAAGRSASATYNRTNVGLRASPGGIGSRDRKHAQAGKPATPRTWHEYVAHDTAGSLGCDSANRGGSNLYRRHRSLEGLCGVAAPPGSRDPVSFVRPDVRNPR